MSKVPPKTVPLHSFQTLVIVVVSLIQLRNKSERAFKISPRKKSNQSIRDFLVPKVQEEKKHQSRLNKKMVKTELMQETDFCHWRLQSIC